MEEVYNFQTGDLILFNSNHFWTPIGVASYLIKFFTKSDWTHIGMIVKDPSDFLQEDLPKGIYLWQSSFEFDDAEDHKMKLAVQLTPLKDKLKSTHGIVHWRKLNPGSIEITNEKLKEIHHLVHNKPYDINPIDWFDALIEHQTTRHTDRYFCSALVARIYSFLGLIDSEVDWSIIKPSSFSTETTDDKEHIVMIGGSSLGPEVELQNN